MNIFSRLAKGVKSIMDKAGAETRLSREFKNIFELGGVPAFNQFYYFGIFIWKYLYKGYYKLWHRIAAPTIADQSATRDLFRMDLAKAISAELASLIWSEKCKVNVSARGFEPTEEQPTDDLGDFVHSVLCDNAFFTKMQEHIEQSMALGGGALKVWCESRRDAEGNVVPDTEQVKIGYSMADQFVPTAWDNAKVSEGVFISRIAKDAYYYTRLEWHKWNGNTYYITNELYRADKKKGSDNVDKPEDQDILGFRYPLATIYPFLDEQTQIKGIEQSLFSYYRTPIANNIDDNSPLGVSIYANALSTLHALDICYDSLVTEFRLGRKRIIVPARCVRTVIDPKTGVERRYFDARDEVYEALATDDENALKIQDNSVALRVEEHVAALNALLSTLCLQIGFSASTFSFDMASGLKTATEVISEQSKTYKTVKACQNMIRPAIVDLVENIIAVAKLYGISWNGKSIEQLAKDYDVSIVFDDSIIEDKQTIRTMAMSEVNSGLMAKKTYLMTIKGMTPEQADAELQLINEQGAIDGRAVDLVFGGGID